MIVAAERLETRIDWDGGDFYGDVPQLQKYELSWKKNNIVEEQ